MSGIISKGFDYELHLEDYIDSKHQFLNLIKFGRTFCPDIVETSDGINNFSRNIIRRTVSLTKLQGLIAVRKITSDDGNHLLKLISSQDVENLMIAEKIIDDAYLDYLNQQSS